MEAAAEMKRKSSCTAAPDSPSKPTFKWDFFKSPAGWFKVAEIISGVLVFALVAGSKIWRFLPAMPGLQFVMVVAISAWISTVLLSAMYVFSFHSTILSNLPWYMIEFAFNASWSALYLAAAIVAATLASDFWVLSQVLSNYHLVGSATFSFVTTALYICHSFYALKMWRGIFPWSRPRGERLINP